MNVANLQLQGLIMAMAALNQMLVAKGLASTEEITRSLDIAEQTMLGDYQLERLGHYFSYAARKPNLHAYGRQRIPQHVGDAA